MKKPKEYPGLYVPYIDSRQLGNRPDKDKNRWKQPLVEDFQELINKAAKQQDKINE